MKEALRWQNCGLTKIRLEQSPYWFIIFCTGDDDDKHGGLLMPVIEIIRGIARLVPKYSEFS